MEELDLLGAEYIAGLSDGLLWVVTSKGVERARNSKQGESGAPVKWIAIGRKDGGFLRWANEGDDQLGDNEAPYRSATPPPPPLGTASTLPSVPTLPVNAPLPLVVKEAPRPTRGGVSLAAFLGSVVGIGVGAHLWENHRVAGGILGYLIGYPAGGAAGMLMGLEE